MTRIAEQSTYYKPPRRKCEQCNEGDDPPLSLSACFSHGGGGGHDASVHVQRVVEVDAGENGEHIGLEECDQDLKPGECHHEGERRPAAEQP
jgi:hypothetical protein